MFQNRRFIEKAKFFLLPLICSFSLGIYYYAVSLDFRFFFLEDGALMFREIANPLQKGAPVFTAVSFIALSAAKVVLDRRNISPSVLFYLCLPALFALTFLPGAVVLPELVPIAAVLLPAAAGTAFLVSALNRPFARSNPRAGRRGKFDRISAGVFAVFFAVFFLSGYRLNETAGYHSGDEGHYLTMARSMAEDFDLDIRNQIAGYTPAMRRQVHISPFAPEDSGYSWHPPGLSFVFAPFFRIYDEHRSGKRGALFSLYILGALLAANVYLAGKEHSGSAGAGLIAAAAIMLSSPMWIYSVRAYPMMPGALCMLYCWRKIQYLEKLKIPLLLLFSASLAWLLWLHDTFIPAYGLLCAVILVFWIKNVKDRRLLAALILQALNAAVFVFFRFRWYGAAFFGQQGALFNFWPGLFGAWLDSSKGIISSSPVHLLGFILIFAYALKKRGLPGIMLVLLYLSIYIPGNSSSMHWRGGASHLGRRLAPCIPLAAAPLACFFYRKRGFAFRWLVVFLGVLSVAFMFYTMIFNPPGFTRPLNSMVLSEQLFRPLSFHLPSFGTGLRGFPWSHFLFAFFSLLAVISFWAVLAAKEKIPSPKFMNAGMAVTLLWAFISIPAMKSFSGTSPPDARSPELNFRGNVMRIAEPLEYPRLIMYSTDVRERVSFSYSRAGLPHHRELSRGLYEIKIEGSAPPGAEAVAGVIYIRRGIRLGRFPLSANGNGSFESVKYLYMPERAEAVSVYLSGEEAGFEVEKTVLTPVPEWVEGLAAHIESTGRRRGFLRQEREDPLSPVHEIPGEAFGFSSAFYPGELRNMADGNPHTRWTPLIAQAPGQYFEVDMGREHLISGIRLIQGDFWKDWPRGLAVYASVDGKNWDKAYDDSGAMAGYVYRDKYDFCFRSMENCAAVKFYPVETRHLRVEQTGRERIYWWSVAGFSVLAEAE